LTCESETATSRSELEFGRGTRIARHDKDPVLDPTVTIEISRFDVESTWGDLGDSFAVSSCVEITVRCPLVITAM
jgi:hypothetical protein